MNSFFISLIRCTNKHWMFTQQPARMFKQSKSSNLIDSCIKKELYVLLQLEDIKFYLGRPPNSHSAQIYGPKTNMNTYYLDQSVLIILIYFLVIVIIGLFFIPGLNTANKSSSLAISKNLVRFRKGDISLPPSPKSNTPLSGSCKFHGT